MTYKTDARSNSYTRFFSACILTITLLCVAAFVCGTAGAVDIYVPEGGNQTISKAGAVSILQFESAKSDLTDAQKKLSTDLLQLLDSTFLPEGQNRETLEVQMANSGQFRPAGSVSPIIVGKVADDLVYVYVYLKPPAGTRTIEPYVWEITDRDEDNHLAVAWVEVEKLETLASLKGVRTIRTVMPPLVMAGSVITEGDDIHRTSDVRATYSQSGSGVKVGIISDGVDSWTNARDSGDLPADLTVLSNTLGGDEGTAMLEIVHDMVPDADLYFHDCGSNTVAFSNAIDALVTAGCDVICDDIGWITEPSFEDGTIASHLTSVLASNDIIYASSAGNAGQRHYQGDYYNIPSYNQHDFSRGGTTGYYLYLNMSASSSVRIVLQWNDQFGSSGNDYNLYLYNMGTSTIVAWSEATQDGDDDPLEWISYTVPGGTATGNYAIIVDKWSGVGKTLEVFIYPGSGCTVYSNNINATDSIFGHAAVPGAIAVGAIDASDPGNDDIELFSSQGPVTISYPSPVSRAKPDLCGIDGVAVTGAGSFPSTFYGTSAAAPHVAAIAAQLWGAYPDKTGDEIRTVLYDSAVDLGSASYDNIYGYGRADALDAFEAVIPCTCGDICVNTSGWWRDSGAFNASSTPIQAAVDNATAGDVICVWDGTYNENVDVDVAHLTIRSQNGSANCIVNAANSGDHVFDVQSDYVNISGFAVSGATGNSIAGIYLFGRQHCNISDNNASNDYFGIYLYSSSNNTLTNNTANSNNYYGIYLDSSSNNTLTNNTANSNNYYGIYLSSSSNNTLTGNTANSNTKYGIPLYSSSNNTLTNNTANSNTPYGIYLASSSNNTLTNNTANSNTQYGICLSSSSNNNTLTNNTASGNNYGICLSSSSNNNTLTSNTASGNNYGIYLDSSSNNTLTNNTASGNNYGIYLDSSSNNNVSCNWVQNNTDAGFYLEDGSTGNTIENNNIIANGNYNDTSDGYEWQFMNDQSDEVSTAGNWWGTDNTTRIDASICDWTYDALWGNVTTSPRLDGPAPCAPIPELPTVLLFAVGLLMLAGYVRVGRRK